jgi:AraC family transcriptional regulator of adaptative response/methylated-DNA-[protein]-cysteine methyltransferase
MMFDLPDHDTLYAALLNRNPDYDGRAYVCVTSTGIFCRLTCPARKPKPDNCLFFATIGECIEAGFRACKRCHPLAPSAEADPMIGALLAALDARPDLRWREGHVTQMGFDPSTVRRSFKRQFGMTFLEMARQRRLREGFESLGAGEKVITAQQDAGFDSPSAFRRAFARLLGCAPAEIAKEGLLHANWIPTPLGDMIAVADRTHLHLLEFVDRKALPTELTRLRKAVKGDLGIGRTEPMDQMREELGRYFEGKSARFETPLVLNGTPFTQSVWRALMDIPAGETRTYTELAQAIGKPGSVRAVARANGANQIALVVPCHRILGMDGSLTGYGGGLWRKQSLIEIERQFATQDTRKTS